MMSTLTTSIPAVSLIAATVGGAVATGVVGLVINHYLGSKVKSAIDHDSHLRKTAHEQKREACLNALTVVDACFSHKKWTSQGGEFKPIPQSYSIADVRRAHGQLAIWCENTEIIALYENLLGLRAPGEENMIIDAGTIVKLRNAMRKELGLSEIEDFNRKLSWIAYVPGAHET